MCHRNIISSLLILFMVMSVFLTAFSFPPGTPNQPTVEFERPAIQAEDGREFTAADWVTHLPLACAVVVVVLGVNGVFLGKIIRDRRQGRIGG